MAWHGEISDILLSSVTYEIGQIVVTHSMAYAQNKLLWIFDLGVSFDTAAL